MKTILTILALGLLSNVHAQEFILRGGLIYSPEKNTKQVEVSNQSSIFWVIGDLDTTYYQSEVERTTNSTDQFKPDIGYQFGVDLSWRIKEQKLSVATGLGMGLFRFSHLNTIDDFETETLSTTQIDNPFITFNPFGTSSYCDVYLSSPDLQNISTTPDKLFIGDLLIPIGIKYSMLNNSLEVGANVIFSTPLFSKHTYLTSVLERTEENGQYICRSEAVEQNDQSGNYLANLKVGAGLDVTYWLGAVGLQLAIQPSLSRMFSDPEKTSSTVFGKRQLFETDFQPIFFRGQLSYRFGSTKEPVE